MAVDLSSLVENVKAEVQPPGEDVYPDATDDDWVMRLINAFWSAVLDGIITGYAVDDDGIVSPVTGTTDLKCSRSLCSMQVSMLFETVSER
jgi:hypothetical protein